MQMTRAGVLTALVMAAPGIVGAAAPFTAKFGGTGRACSGGFYVRTKTIEWNSSFSICKPARYEVLEQETRPGGERYVFRLKSRSRHCLYEVIEAERASTYGWNVQGYQSLESYQKRAQPEWADSSREDRLVLSCPMVRLE